LRVWVRRQFGISYANENCDVFTSRVADLCAELGLTAEALLARVAGGDTRCSRRLAEAVSTNHTFFFRERDVFTYFSQTIAPTLSSSGPIRLWSAAASSGEEAYSIAIALAASLGAGALERVRLLGTDISDRQIQAAERGMYSNAQLGETTPAQVGIWFRPAEQGQLEIAPALKRVCSFRRMNLIQFPWPFEQRFHVIWMRNVLYYFEPPLRARVLEAAFDAAEPGAWLITSLTEPMLDSHTRWTSIKPAIFRKGSR
jgi:chemotaxis protein methyltransferase CheR